MSRRATAPGYRTAQAADGRRLAFTEWGDPAGRPILWLHGTPGSRLARHPNDELQRAAGARVVTYDRPGYGGSDRHRGRTVADCAGDVAAIADTLGIDEFAVAGTSGGGPHALAVAALLGNRVTRAACVVGVAPYEAMGEAWTAGMDPENVKEFGWVFEGEERLHEHLVAEYAAYLARVQADPATAFGDFDLPEADRAVLQRADFGRMFREDTVELGRNGVWGWVDDDIVFMKPWGFDVSTIRVPTAVWYGSADVMVPPTHGRWLGEHVPGATVRVTTGHGHLGDPDKDLVDLYGWLLDGRAWDQAQ